MSAARVAPAVEEIAIGTAIANNNNNNNNKSNNSSNIKAQQYDYKYSDGIQALDQQTMKEMHWSCALKSWNCHSRHDYRALALELSSPYPREFNLERPITIENCSQISGLWRVWSVSDCGCWLFCQIHENDKFEQFPPQRGWEVKRPAHFATAAASDSAGDGDGDGDAINSSPDRHCGLVICRANNNNNSSSNSNNSNNNSDNIDSNNNSSVNSTSNDPQQQQHQQAIVRLAPVLQFLVRATVLRIAAVDTAEQRFTAEVYCEFTAAAVSSCEKQATVEHALSFYGLDNHRLLHFLNGSGEVETWSNYRPNKHDPRCYDYSYNCRFKGEFNEEFELKSFPFDVQQLTIVIALMRSAEFIKFIPNGDDPSSFVYSQFQMNNLFTVSFKDMVMQSIKLSDPISSATSVSFPEVHYQLRLSRSPWFYINNIALPTMVLTFLSFVSFAVNSDGSKIETSDRLSVTLTLLLTAVAYKFAVASSLPKVSYVTILDGYILSCFAVMVLVAVMNCLFPYLEWRYQSSAAAIADWEYYSVVIVMLIFVIYNIVLQLYLLSSAIHCQRESMQLLVSERTRRVVNSVHWNKSLEERKKITELALLLRQCNRTMRERMGITGKRSHSGDKSMPKLTDLAALAATDAAAVDKPHSKSPDLYRLEFINDKVDLYNKT